MYGILSYMRFNIKYYIQLAKDLYVCMYYLIYIHNLTL